MQGSGTLSEKGIEELQALWKKCVGEDITKLHQYVGKISELATMLNNIPNMQLVRIKAPELSLGGFQHTGSVAILMLYELPKEVPEVPADVRAAFFDVVAKVNHNFPVYEVKIGFKGHMDVNVVIMPPDDRGHIAVHHCPMLQIRCTV